MDGESEFITRLTEALAGEDLVPESRQRVLIDCRQLETWYLGTYGQPMDPGDVALTSVDLAEFRAHVLKSCQASTCSRKFASIRAMLRLLAPVLLTTIRMPKVPQPTKPAPSGFTKKERLAIFRAAEKLSARDKAIIYLAMWTGARASSLAAAKLSHVDLKARSGSIRYDIAKGGAGKAYSIPLNIEAREALEGWLKERLPVKHDYLFTSEKYPYDEISRWTIHDIWHRRLAKHLPKELAEKLKGTHQARHALGRLLAEQNVPVPDIALVLNHSSLSTVGLYTKPSADDVRRHLERAAGEDGDE